jgi:hypothetical protein
MYNRRSPRPRARFPLLCAWSLLVLCLLLSLGTMMAGCGGASSGAETTAPEATTATTAAATAETTAASTAASADMGWHEWTDALVAVYSEAIQKLNVLLEGLPEPATVQSQVESLKEEYIQKFVELGRVKATFSEADKASSDSLFWSSTYSIEDQAWYTSYADTYNAYLYANADVDFCNLVHGFNILTQYADFALLKKQLPEEAARLGVE